MLWLHWEKGVQLVEGDGGVLSVVSYFVVNVGRALRRHLLDDIDGVPVVPADLLVVWAVSRVRRPEGDDDVAGLGAIVVGARYASAAPTLGAGEGGERQWRVVGVRVLGMPPPVAHDADDGGDQQEEGRAPRRSGDKGNVRRLQGSILIATFLSERRSGLGGIPT